MGRTVLLALLATLTAFVGRAQDISGDWQGALNVNGAELHLLLHITKSDSGALQATMDSVDQGAYGLSVTSISVEGSNLTFAVDSVHGSYEGKVNQDASTITGTWSQGRPLPLEWKRAAATAKPKPTRVESNKAANPSDIDGTWVGTLDTGTIKLRVVFNIVNTEHGLIAAVDSPDQGMKGLPASSVIRDGRSLRIEAKKIGGVFGGTIAADFKSIDGIWTQGGVNFPLVLRPITVKKLQRARPQNPIKPYPYKEEEVSYENKTQKITLAGTLTIPQGEGPFPAVILITGSGPQDRDESLMGHKPFLVLADYLTRKGIAVLRTDDRGVGKSTGEFAAATTADFATDTEAALVYLKTRAEVHPHKIGLVGHSEGGIIAPMVAARNADVDFIVMMAGSGVPGDEILAAQYELIAEANGKSHNDTAKAVAKEREVVAVIKNEKDTAKLEKELRTKLKGDVPEAQLEARIKMVTSPWLRYFVAYDPATALRGVKCPVLVINGEKDLQVPAKQNLRAIRKALEEGGNTHFEVVEFPGLNHLFQTSKTGAPGEYAEIEETISPVVLEKIASWILKQ